jgi:hypothetical protein
MGQERGKGLKSGANMVDCETSFINRYALYAEEIRCGAKDTAGNTVLRQGRSCKKTVSRTVRRQEYQGRGTGPFRALDVESGRFWIAIKRIAACCGDVTKKPRIPLSLAPMIW